MSTDYCYLMVVKDSHRYMFKYSQGEEKKLFFTLIDYGKDDDFNITLIEVLHLIRKISAHLKEKGFLKNYTFHVTPEEAEG